MIPLKMNELIDHDRQNRNNVNFVEDFDCDYRRLEMEVVMVEVVGKLKEE
jgi:hypothetical protein